MPRAVDRHPDKRGVGNSLWDPNRSGLSYTDPLSQIDDAAVRSGQLIRNSVVTIIRDLTGIDLASWETFLQTMLDATGINLEWLRDAVQELIDGVANAFGAAVETGQSVADAIAALLGIKAVAGDAGASADRANIGVLSVQAQLDAGASGGHSFAEEFDYASANALPSGSYRRSAIGAGQYGTDGSGSLIWKPSGGSDAEILYAYTPLGLASNKGVVRAQLSTRVQPPIFSDAYTYIMAHIADATNATRVQLRIGDNDVAIEAVIGGAVEVLKVEPLTAADNETWELYFDAYHFWAKRNGATVIDTTTDSSHVHIGAGYSLCGVGGKAANYLVFFQNPPSKLAGWTFSDLL